MSASDIKTLKISTKSMVTALDKDGKPVPEFTGTLADIGPKLKEAFPQMKIGWGNLTSQLPT